MAAFPLLLSALAALWAYYRFRHPWRSAGVSVGYEPDDGWATKQGGELEHFFFAWVKRRFLNGKISGPRWHDHSLASAPREEDGFAERGISLRSKDKGGKGWNTTGMRRRRRRSTVDDMEGGKGDGNFVGGEKGEQMETEH